jgi:dsDNA-specific endonuclease/ATPase MutS2
VTGDDKIPDSVEIEINGVLDLHYFQPKDLKTLIPDYVEECHKRGIFSLRIIHGKGIGAVRESVHALLKRNARVASFTLAEPMAGGWGATLVELRP